MKKDNIIKIVISFVAMLLLGYLAIFIYIILGILGLKYGADFVVDEATNIANYFSISPAIISITIVAIGTSLPEIATAVIASLRKDSDLAVGNVIGSNIYNICLLPGIGAVITPIEYSFNTTIIFLIIATLAVLILSNYKGKRKIGRGKALILLLLYVGYIINLFS